MGEGAETITATATDTAGNTQDTQTINIVTVSDDVSIHGSAAGNLVTGVSADDTTPTLTGTLSTALTGSQVLAIYDNDGDGTSKLAVVTVNADNAWTFTTPVLTNGSYTLKAVIQAADETGITNGRVISESTTITVEASVTALTTINAITTDNMINLNEVTTIIMGTVDYTDSTVKLTLGGQA